MLRRSLALLAAPALLAAAPAAHACEDERLRADVRGADGDERVVAVESAGGRPRIAVFGADGRRLAAFFAYEPGFRGGVDVAAGDVDGDGVDEIVVAAGAGGGPNVRVFDGRGNRLADFFAFDPAFLGGVRVGVTDVDGDGVDEIVARRADAPPSPEGAVPTGAHAFTGAGVALGEAGRGDAGEPAADC